MEDANQEIKDTRTVSGNIYIFRMNGEIIKVGEFIVFENIKIPFKRD